ncbi:hypothetical protein [Streptomyces sp. NBC_00582]|uniref:hypothetical protein n=1 Tax=Streptomyces sp. NBC_00582 TaxID=2975783 RepID=UPI002E809592|nr:hypothetical protein [Streptomyces sp. NBC_00582]WUB64475.1 hypothetical protein OG852_30805 [Streptomyces sp. NBC_00582]
MTGATTTAEWLACAGIGTGGGTTVLLLLKVAIDGPPHLELPHPKLPRRAPRPVSPPPAQAGHGRHAGPAALDETASLTCVSHARHSKGRPWN